MWDIIEQSEWNKHQRKTSVSYHPDLSPVVVFQAVLPETGEVGEPIISGEVTNSDWRVALAFTNAMSVAVGIARSWDNDTGKARAWDRPE